MDDHQLVCYPRSGTRSLMGSVCCILLIFPLSNILSISSSRDKNLRYLSSLSISSSSRLMVKATYYNYRG